MLRGAVDAAEIPLWFDRSGLQNNGVGATAGARPYAEVSHAWARGFGLSAAFDGTADSLVLTNDTTSMPTSFFAVARRQGSDTNTRGILVTHVHGWYTALDASNQWAMFENVAALAGQSITGTNPPFIVTTVCRAFNDVDFLTNGGAKVTRTNMSSGQARGGTRLGSDPSGVQFFSGSIAEVIWFGRAVSVSERRAIEEYLYRRFVTPPTFAFNPSPE